MPDQPTALPDHPFWEFSLDVYGRPTVADECIALQDRCGVDVNLVLFFIWVAVAGYGRLEEKIIRQCIEDGHQWQTAAVIPIRTVRRDLKAHIAGIPDDQREMLREQIAHAELEAEHVEQLRLAEIVQDLPVTKIDPDRAAADAVANLKDYLQIAELTAGPVDLARLADIVAIGIEGSDKEKIMQAVQA